MCVFHIPEQINKGVQHYTLPLEVSQSDIVYLYISLFAGYNCTKVYFTVHARSCLV